MTQSGRLQAEPIKFLSFDDIGALYSPLGTIDNPSQIYFVQNLTNATLTFSFDGVSDYFQLPASGFLLLDVGTNKGTMNTLSFPAGLVLYVAGSPGSGRANLTTWYMG